MAAGVRPPTFQPFGEQGPTVYLSNDNNPPAAAGDGTFKIGDLIWNTAPAAGGTLVWVVTTAGTGATAVFKAVAVAA